MNWEEIYERSITVVRRVLEEVSDDEPTGKTAGEDEMSDVVKRLQDSDYLYMALNRRERFDYRVAYRKLKGNEKRKKYLRVVALVSGAACVVVACCLTMLQGERKHERGESIEQLAPSRSMKAILVKADGEELLLSEQRRLLQEGASVMAVDSSGIQYALRDTLDEDSLMYNTLIVPRGGVYQLTLADGTKVWLNSDSRLIYPVAFSGSVREVRLSGEAYFDVEKDTGKSFVVKTDLGNVRVLGTQFNVKFYPEETCIVTTLVTGRVSYSNPVIQDIELYPGYQLMYEKGHQEVDIKKVNVQNFIDWRDGEMSFQSKSLEDIMNVLARWYDVDVVFEDETLKELVFSGNLDKYKDIRVFFKLFELSANVEFVITGKVIHVKAKR